MIPEQLEIVEAAPMSHEEGAREEAGLGWKP